MRRSAHRENAAGPGQPCAQSFGILETATGVSRRWSRSDMLAMKDAGITLIVQDPDGNVFAEDAITVVDPAAYPQYGEVSGMRVTMAIRSQIRTVLRSRLSARSTPKVTFASSAAKDCVRSAVAWHNRGALYGETPDEAFQVTVTGDRPERRLAAWRRVLRHPVEPAPSA